MTALLVLPLILSAAAPDALDVVRRFHAEEARRRAAHARSARAAPLADVGYDVQRYDLAIRLADTSGAAAFRISAAAGIELRTLRALDDVTLDLLGLSATSVQVDGVPAAFDRDPPGAPERLIVHLPAQAAAGTAVRVDVAYEGRPEPADDFGWPSGMLFDESLPGVFTSNQTDHARRWFPCHDHPSDKAALRLAVTTPVPWVAAANGLLESVEQTAAGTTFTWVSEIPTATYLVVLAAGAYGVVEDARGALPLRHYVRAGSESRARLAFAEVPAMLDAFEARFGPYPFEKYGHATAPIPGGMENQSLTTLHPSLVSRQGELVIAHELAHQWWGDLVTCADWDDIWLNEGFAVFGEALWIEAQEGEEAYRDYLDELAADAIDADAGDERTPLHDPVVPFGTIVYQKGGRVLALLRDRLGDDAFFRALLAYRAAHERANATTADLRAALESASGRDLGAFFAQWVEQAGEPEVSGVWRRRGRAVEIALRQLQPEPAYDLPVDVELLLEGGGARREVLALGRKEQTFALCAEAPVVGVRLDPDRRQFWILHGLGLDSTTAADDSACPSESPDAGPPDAGAADGGSAGAGGDAGCGCGAAGAGLAALAGLAARRRRSRPERASLAGC